ncbi:hypothetical protein GQ55_5G110200 [Panicum hallii var. hallii]|uniref:Uncharacterized protein n=1 Tax=Panicum hallii var. hallii TaxID=1504633 RepID=A0A2T7DF42_9POAL|nr:hypothetical protein GQ55_5G110200 [Panicum hallii var. hallii]
MQSSAAFSSTSITVTTSYHRASFFERISQADNFSLCGCGMDLARHSAPELGKRGRRRDARQLLDHGDHFCCEVAQHVDAKRLRSCKAVSSCSATEGTWKCHHHTNRPYRVQTETRTDEDVLLLSKSSRLPFVSVVRGMPPFGVEMLCRSNHCSIRRAAEEPTSIWPRCRHDHYG